MKVLILNGSPRKESNSMIAINQMLPIFKENEIETEIIQIGNMDIPGCKACGYCVKTGKCVYNDIVNEVASKLDEADGLVIASPVYFASANATVIALLDRLFYSTKKMDKRMKVGASIVTLRRSGSTASLDELNKYFAYVGMPIATSQYWNQIHGRELHEAEQDIEGKQIMRTLANNMCFLLKSIELGKKEFGLPELEEYTPTNFIR